MMERNSPSESNFYSSVLNKYLNVELELKLAFTLVQMQPVFSVGLIRDGAEGISEPLSQSQQI